MKAAQVYNYKSVNSGLFLKSVVAAGIVILIMLMLDSLSLFVFKRENKHCNVEIVNTFVYKEPQAFIG